MSLEIIHALKRTTATKRRILFSVPSANKISLASSGRYTAISRKVVGKNVYAAIPKGNMAYDQSTVPDFAAVEPTFVAFCSTRKHMCMASRVILSTFFEEH